ncbi:MAG: hypothetical protein QXT61_05675, partial [Candidatus Caldarchaeum sp.]
MPNTLLEKMKIPNSSLVTCQAVKVCTDSRNLSKSSIRGEKPPRSMTNMVRKAQIVTDFLERKSSLNNATN